jgi:RNA polymerase sigma-B factor
MLTPALASLSSAERELLRMSFIEGRRQSEIGQHLGISQTHVSRRIAQALKRLRVFMGETTEAGTAA